MKTAQASGDTVDSELSALAIEMFTETANAAKKEIGAAYHEKHEILNLSQDDKDRAMYVAWSSYTFLNKLPKIFGSFMIKLNQAKVLQPDYARKFCENRLELIHYLKIKALDDVNIYSEFLDEVIQLN